MTNPYYVSLDFYDQLWLRSNNFLLRSVAMVMFCRNKTNTLSIKFIFKLKSKT